LQEVFSLQKNGERLTDSKSAEELRAVGAVRSPDFRACSAINVPSLEGKEHTAATAVGFQELACLSRVNTRMKARTIISMCLKTA
jgi:hypothetical protein